MSNDTTAEERLRALAAEQLHLHQGQCPCPHECSVGFPCATCHYKDAQVGTAYKQLADDLTAVLDALAAERAARVQAEGVTSTAAAEAAALREALERDRLVIALIEANDAGHLDWTPRGIADCIIDATAALATPPSAAVQRVQGIVAAAERVLVEYDLLLRQQPSLATTTIPYQPYEALRAALNGNEADR